MPLQRCKERPIISTEKLLHSRLSVELLLICIQKFLHADAHGNTIILELQRL